MDVKPGFNRTEAGVIPQDWRVETIEQISTVGRGRVISHKEIARSISPRYPVYSSQTSNNGAMGYLDTFAFEGEYITWTTDGANAGTVFYRNGRFNCTNVCGTIKLRLDNHSFVAKVLGTIASRHVSRHLGNPKLMNDVMKQVKIPLPPTIAEQEAIAEALSDADALIESLEQLLAKKRHIKQGAMQELLTGKKRLPGFSGEWKVQELRDVCVKIQDGTHFSPKLGGSDFLYVTSKNIRSGMLDLSSTETISASEHAKIYARCDVARGDLLLTKDGANTGNAALNTIDEPFSLLPSVAMLRFDSRRHVAGYFLYQILSPHGQQQIKELMSGNAITRLTLAKIRSLRFSVAPIQEQAAIATILSDMDTEIVALEVKLTKARAVKQGMMQELLTGRIRLV